MWPFSPKPKNEPSSVTARLRDRIEGWTKPCLKYGILSHRPDETDPAQAQNLIRQGFFAIGAFHRELQDVLRELVDRRPDSRLKDLSEYVAFHGHLINVELAEPFCRMDTPILDYIPERLRYDHNMIRLYDNGLALAKAADHLCRSASEPADEWKARLGETEALVARHFFYAEGAHAFLYDPQRHWGLSMALGWNPDQIERQAGFLFKQHLPPCLQAADPLSALIEEASTLDFALLALGDGQGRVISPLNRREELACLAIENYSNGRQYREAGLLDPEMWRLSVALRTLGRDLKEDLDQGLALPLPEKASRAVAAEWFDATRACAFDAASLRRKGEVERGAFYRAEQGLLAAAKPVYNALGVTPAWVSDPEALPRPLLQPNRRFPVHYAAKAPS